MKLLLALEGYENILIQEPDVPGEISAFVAKLIQSRTRGPMPRVLALPVSENNVMVDVEALMGLQKKAGENHLNHSEAEKLLREIFLSDSQTIEGDRIMTRALERAKKLLEGK